MQESDFYSFGQWRAVDVEGEDGMVRRGLVTDMDPGRNFTVDFGYPGHGEDVIPSDKCWERRPGGAFHRGSSVEVLMRLSADRPLRWFPSKVLAGCSDSYAFVAVDLGEKTVQDFVSFERIIISPVKKHVFVCDKKSLKLPSDQELLTLIEREDFFQIWNKLYNGTRAIAIRDGRLEYLSEPRSNLRCSDALFTLLASWYHPHTMLSGFNESRDSVEPHPHPFNSEYSTERPDVLQMSLACINKVLPAEIILKTFSFLNVYDQIKCRYICQKWRDLLQLFRRVEIDLDKFNQEEKLAMAVHKVVTSGTRILVLTGSHRDGPDTLPVLRIVIEMLKAKSITVPVIVISPRTVWADDLLDYSDPMQLKFRAEWTDVCEKLVLEHVNLWALFRAQDEQNRTDGADFAEPARLLNWYHKDPNEPALMIFKGVTNTKEVVKMVSVLNILEEVCPKPESVGDAVSFVKRNLGEICQETSSIWREIVFKMLRKWQSDDSRFYSNTTWNQDHLAGIALESLRKLTVLALRHHLPQRPRNRQEEWDREVESRIAWFNHISELNRGYAGYGYDDDSGDTYGYDDYGHGSDSDDDYFAGL